MNRKQAEHILDAYVRMRMRECDKDASDALREVILDAMTENRTEPNYQSVKYPYATWCELGGETKLPTVWDGTPKITCTGVDPAFRDNTTAVGE